MRRTLSDYRADKLPDTSHTTIFKDYLFSNKTQIENYLAFKKSNFIAESNERSKEFYQSGLRKIREILIKSVVITKKLTFSQLNKSCRNALIIFRHLILRRDLLLIIIFWRKIYRKMWKNKRR